MSTFFSSQKYPSAGRTENMSEFTNALLSFFLDVLKEREAAKSVPHGTHTETRR
jgi:hypothetical protein